ncbi:MAG: tRNA lysidine(34) synthetase TilS [Neisseria sp.]|nr:tRNA lysidine(34) synthetase TilS [Neisseria sp.]
MDNSPKNNRTHEVWQSWSAHCAGHFSCEVALSGGLDSVVLLHIMCALRDEYGIRIHAVHVHHGLQAAADDWVRFCTDLCARWQVPLRIERVTVHSAGTGIESAARQARYAAFAGSLQPVIALAHHRDDQVETFLLSMLRGGGVRGMSAMPPVRRLNERICLWRPLLNVSRKQLEAYAAAYDLPFVNDPSNAETHYLRNWLRHDILPVVHKRLPAADAHIMRNIDSLQHTLRLLDEVTAADYQAVSPQQGVLDCTAWHGLSTARRNEVLRRFAQDNHLGVASVHSVRDFAQHLFRQPQGHHVWHLPNGEAHAQYGRLWAWSRHDALRDGQWDINLLHWQTTAVWGLPESENWTQSYSLRTVTPQDTLATRGGHKNVVKLLQEKKIPAFIRRYWAVVVDKNDICRAVVNLRCDEIEGVRGGKLPCFTGFERFLTELCGKT